MKRREMLLTAGAAVGLSAFPWGWIVAEEKKRKRLLYYTRSVGFVHSVVDRRGKKDLAYSEKILVELGAKHGFEVVCSQDPKVVEDDLDQFDAIAFYTSGDAITQKGKERLLAAIDGGKGFVGVHSATDTFRFPKLDPYIAMLGAKFVMHGAPQKATMKVVSPKFPGIEGLGQGFEFFDEWYIFETFAPDLHVILVQETAGMQGPMYQRPPYPATWAKRYGKGRVFYTSMGHFENVWTNAIFQQVLLGGIAWALDNVEADVTPNIAQVAPEAEKLNR